MSKADLEFQSAQAVDAAKRLQDNQITLSTGVVLQAKPANPLIMVRVMAAFPRPRPPLWTNPTMGREMENPDDPDYLERVKSWKAESGNAILNALILLGTELVSKPDGMPGPDDIKSSISENSDGKGKTKKKPVPSWLEEYEVFGLPLHPFSASWRYLTWVIFKAAPKGEDLNRIKEVVGRLSGIPEKDVKAAEDFPGSN